MQILTKICKVFLAIFLFLLIIVIVSAFYRIENPRTYEFFDFSQYEALQRGNERDRQLANAILVHAFYLEDVGRQCEEHKQSYAIAEVYEMIFSVDCTARARYKKVINEFS